MVDENKNAFTLVELLLVISVISLMMAMLYPLLASTRKISKQLICAANLSQTAKAIRGFAADNSDIIIPAKEMTYAHSLKEFRQSWHIALLPYVAEKIKKNPLDNFSQLWLCPEDSDPYPRGFMNNPHSGMTSYGLNGFSEQVDGKLLKLGPAGGFKFSQIKQSSQCMLMGETSYAGQFYDIESEKTSDMGIRKYGHHRMTSGFYHNASMNILFVDGHVEKVKGKKCPPDSKYYPANYKNKNYAFWDELTLPGADENASFWGQGY